MSTTHGPAPAASEEVLLATPGEALRRLRAAAGREKGGKGSKGGGGAPAAPSRPGPPIVGPRPTAALGLLGKAEGTVRFTTYSEASSEGLRPELAALATPDKASPDELAGVSPLLLPIPADHRCNRRSDEHTDFDQLHAQGLIRDRQGEIIQIRSLWQAWGAYRIDRFFQAYCQKATDAAARGEPFPADSVRQWVTDEAQRIGMPLHKALSIIRDGCSANAAHNSMWWRGASLPPRA